MELTSYEQVRNWSNMIQYVTEIRYMPPWKPDPNYSRFLGENYLTEQEIELIGQWVDQGAPQGDPNDEPDLPEFPEGSQLGSPDLVVSFSESFEHQGNNQDEYRIFVLPTGLTEDKIVKAVELRAGNRQIVHHALFTYDDTGQARLLDAATPEYGYDGFGGFGINDAFERQYPGYAPGQRARFFPNGVGQELPAGSDILVQMHYAPVPFSQKDSSTINIFFADADETVDRMVQTYIMVPLGGILQNGPFLIFPNVVKTFHGKITTPVDVSLLSISPHMHLLGQDWTVFSVSPSGDTTNLIRINEWDFNWQGTYTFRKFIKIEAGSEVHAYATYDNTADNPLNPNNPPQLVTWGERTTDEMYYLPISFVEYRQGDEDIEFDEDVLSSAREPEGIKYPPSEFQEIYPNPTTGELNLRFSLAKAGRIMIDMVDINGKQVQVLDELKWRNAGINTLSSTLTTKHGGLFYIRIRGEGINISRKLIYNP